MNTIISNNIKIYNPTLDVENWVEKNLTLTNPNWVLLTRIGKTDLIHKRHVQPTMKFWKENRSINGKCLVVPFGCLYGLWPYIKDGQTTTDFVPDQPNSIKDLDCPYNLFEYQKDALDALVDAKGGIVQAGCGAGKTVIGIEFVHKIGQRFLWIAHTKDLIRQARKDFLNMYPDMDIGIIGDGKCEIGKDGAVATIQSLALMDPSEYASEFNIVVTDETHHVCSDMENMKMYQKVINNIKARYKIGLTATAFRNDSLTKTLYFNVGMHPNGEFRPVYNVERNRVQSLTAKYEKIEADTEFTYDVLNTDGTFNYAYLVDYLCENEHRNEIIVQKVIDLLKEGRKVAILTLRVGHSELLAQKLVEAGVNAVSVTGKTAGKKRKTAIEDITTWDVICSTVSLFKEGLNLKPLDTVMMVAPVQDKASVIQACGRCERPFEGKKDPLFIDVCDIKIPYCISSCKKREKYLLSRI